MTESSGSSASRAEARRKRHHYLPESYLKAWADGNGQVAVRRRDRAVPFCAATRRVAVEADLYALPTNARLDDVPGGGTAGQSSGGADRGGPFGDRRRQQQALVEFERRRAETHERDSQGGRRRRRGPGT